MKRQALCVLASSLVALIFVPDASARTIHVPGDCPIIQIAVNAASDGDTVYIHNSAGPYREDVLIGGKSIVLRGESQLEVAIDGTLTVDAQMWQQVSVEEMQILRGVWVTGGRGGTIFRHVHILDHLGVANSGGYASLYDLCSLSFDVGEHAEIGPFTNVTADGLLVLGRSDPPRFAFRNRGGGLNLVNTSISSFQAAVVNIEGGSTSLGEGMTFTDVVTPIVNLCGIAEIAGIEWSNCQ